MIVVDIKNHLTKLQDDNEKLQFLQEIMNRCQHMSHIIQSKYQVQFAEVVSDDVNQPIADLINEVPA